MTPQEIRSAIESKLPTLRQMLGVKALFVFGSVARGQSRPGSDIDILVDFEGLTDFERFMNLQEILEETLGQRIDLVTRKALREEMRPSIEREAVRVA